MSDVKYDSERFQLYIAYSNHWSVIASYWKDRGPDYISMYEIAIDQSKFYLTSAEALLKARSHE